MRSNDGSDVSWTCPLVSVVAIKIVSQNVDLSGQDANMAADRSFASRVPCELVWHGAMSQRHVRAFNRLNSQQAQLIEIQLISEQSRRSAPFPLKATQLSTRRGLCARRKNRTNASHACVT